MSKFTPPLALPTIPTMKFPVLSTEVPLKAK